MTTEKNIHSWGDHFGERPEYFLIYAYLNILAQSQILVISLYSSLLGIGLTYLKIQVQPWQYRPPLWIHPCYALNKYKQIITGLIYNDFKLTALLLFIHCTELQLRTGLSIKHTWVCLIETDILQLILLLQYPWLKQLFTFKKSTSKNMLQNVLVFATLYCIGGTMCGKCLVSNVSFLSEN